MLMLRPVGALASTAKYNVMKVQERKLDTQSTLIMMKKKWQGASAGSSNKIFVASICYAAVVRLTYVTSTDSLS